MAQELSTTRKTIVGVQFLFVAFGSTVLVPLLVGLDPATALFTAGIGTFLFHLVTKGAVPIFLGSSFAFIAPIISASQQWGMPGTIAGIAGVALVYFVMSALIKWQGRKLLDRLFPPVVIGPVIILIGLSLSPAAVNMAKENWLLAFISLITAIVVLTFGKGLVKLVPVVIGIIVGYIVALCMGLVDLSGVASAPWFALPNSIAHFQLPQFAWEPFVFMIPVAIAPVIEHIGDVYVVSAVAEKDFVKDPGLHRTMLGDGLACARISGGDGASFPDARFGFDLDFTRIDLFGDNDFYSGGIHAGLFNGDVAIAFGDTGDKAGFANDGNGFVRRDIRHASGRASELRSLLGFDGDSVIFWNASKSDCAHGGCLNGDGRALLGMDHEVIKIWGGAKHREF